MRLFFLVARRELRWSSVWVLLVLGLTLLTAPAYGSTVAATFLVVAVATLVVAQAMPTAAGVHRASAVLVGAAFLLRAYGDLQHVPWASSLNPLGLREAVRPFTDNHALPLLAAVATAGCLAVLADVLDSRREPGTGLVRIRMTRDRRLHVHTIPGLTARLGRGSLVAWALAMALGAGLLTAMGSGVVTSAREGRLDGGFLAEQLRGADPATAYFAYTGRILGIAVGAYVVIRVLAAANDERSGLLEHVRATGARRGSPLMAQTAVAAAGALLVLTLAGTASAGVAPGLIGGDGIAGTAFRESVGQWPAVVALAGVGALLVGAAPRIHVLAWTPYGASVLLAMLGTLLKVPDPIVQFGVFGHAPAAWNLNDLAGSAILLAVGFAMTAVGVAAVARRDEVAA